MATHATSGQASSTTTTKKTRHYWRRSNTPRPWWPWGALPLLGLAALFLFGALITAPAIQAEITDGVNKRLDSSGYPSSNVSTDGRRTTVQIGNTDLDDVYVHALAASTTCSTWAGELTCPSNVDIERVAAAAKPAVATSRPHQFEVVRDAESVFLRGEVPSAAEHERIVNLAGGYFGQVKDEMRISNEMAGANYAPAADRAISVVNRLVSGQASWSGEQLSISGTADSGDIGAARAEFDKAATSGMLGRFDVRALERSGARRQECNAAFNDALANATIRFQTGSATIDAGNDELFQHLVSLASTCPGNLTVEGHTDSRGDAEMNSALSMSRASAVRDALAALGIEAARMNAVGYGEENPIADNESAAGRAKNRRIAISVDDPE